MPSSVAPHVGAWIETLTLNFMSIMINVAPHVGAWIETCYRINAPYLQRSLPMWERGLKHVMRDLVIVSLTVAPHVGAWIET